MLAREISGLLPVNTEGGKVARAAAVSPLIEAGNIYAASIVGTSGKRLH
jgi:phage terminase large subunit-like protein